MAIANLYLQRGDVKFISCNEDAFDMVGGKKMPSGGTIIQAMVYGLNDAQSSKRPEMPTLIGKPNPFAWQLIREEHGLADDVRGMMIGDRMDTDICFGNRAGLDTCLVMTGCTESRD
jgi:ribonucleotide monophosphatase NagD (HAD superfamily)